MASLMNLIAQLRGYNKVEGGPTATTDPVTGEQVFTYSPYDVRKKGFLRHWAEGDEKAAELNARLAGEAFLGQEEGRRRIKETKERGKEERLTQAEKAKLESLLGKEKFDQLMQEISTKQRASVLEKEGIPFSEENAKVFEQALTDPRIRNLLSEEGIKNEVLTSPKNKEAVIAGDVQKRLQPLYQNQALSEMTMQPDTVGRFQQITPDSPFGIPMRTEGKTRIQDIVQTGGMRSPTTGEMIGGDTKITTRAEGGGVFPYADQKLIDEAANISDDVSTPEEIPSTRPERGMFRGMSSGTSSGGGTPVMDRNKEELQKLLQLLQSYPMFRSGLGTQNNIPSSYR